MPQCIEYTGVKVHIQSIKRPSVGFNKGAMRQPRAPLVGGTGLSGVHRTVSGAPRGHQLKLFALGNSRKPARYNSPDCPVCTGHVRCSKAGGPRNSPASGSRGSRSAKIHRTVRCAPDCPVRQRSNGSLRRQRSTLTANSTCGRVRAEDQRGTGLSGAA